MAKVIDMFIETHALIDPLTVDQQEEWLAMLKDASTMEDALELAKEFVKTL